MYNTVSSEFLIKFWRVGRAVRKDKIIALLPHPSSAVSFSYPTRHCSPPTLPPSRTY